MSLSTFLENLHAKPVHVRKNIAITTSFSVTLLIGLVWFSTLHLTSNDEVALIESSPNTQVASPAESIRSDLRSIQAGISDLIGLSHSVEEPIGTLEVVETPEAIPLSEREIEFSFEKTDNDGSIRVETMTELGTQEE